MLTYIDMQLLALTLHLTDTSTVELVKFTDDTGPNLLLAVQKINANQSDRRGSELSSYLRFTASVSAELLLTSFFTSVLCHGSHVGVCVCVCVCVCVSVCQCTEYFQQVDCEFPRK